MKSVFILGAGASQEAGGPLMSNFLDVADALRRGSAPEIPKSREAFDNVFSAQSELHGVFAKSYLDLDNLEAFYGAVEMGVLLEAFAQRKPEEITNLRDDLVTLIFQTLQACIRFPRADRGFKAPEPYDLLEKNILEQPAGSRAKDAIGLTFITFNYDLALDVGLQTAKHGFVYHLPTEAPRHTLSIPLLKLHGSINWHACLNCKRITAFPVEPRYLGDFADRRNSRYSRLRLRLAAGSCSHCQHAYSQTPVIVPPTWNKTVYDEQLKHVWRAAARAFKEAENVFVIGYSLPETDLFFRYLFALGSESKVRIKRFWVFDPDPDQVVEDRFRKLVSRGIENRFEFHRVTFREAIPIMRRAVFGL